MITFKGFPLTDLRKEDERISRFFTFHETSLFTRRERIWGAGIIYAEPELIRVQLVDPTVRFDFLMPKHHDTQSYVSSAESAAGVIINALELEDLDYQIEAPSGGAAFGNALPFVNPTAANAALQSMTAQ